MGRFTVFSRPRDFFLQKVYSSSLKACHQYQDQRETVESAETRETTHPPARLLAQTGIMQKGEYQMKTTWIVLVLCLSVAVVGCSSEKAEIKEDRLTVGKVQGEIKVGMPASQVAELLGSPNIVTTDDKRREVWIYDKVSTDRVDTASSSFAGIIILGANTRSSSSSQRQRTLTIIIKYDEEKKVRDFAYNSTQF